MAFVGFKTAQEGNIAIQLLNQSYYQNNKIVVETAKGLDESTMTKNLKIKMEKEKEKAEKIKNESQSKNSNDNNNQNNNNNKNKKRNRKEMEEEEEQNNNNNNNNNNNDYKNKNKKEFLQKRLDTLEKPTWSSEILLPDATASTAIMNEEEEEIINNNNNNNNVNVNVNVNVEEEEEAQIRHKQKVLGEVSDTDFLQMITNNNNDDNDNVEEDILTETKNNNNNNNNTINNSNDDDDDEEEGEGENPSPNNNNNKNSKANNNKDHNLAAETRRVCLMNIPYVSTEAQIKDFILREFNKHHHENNNNNNLIESIHIPLTLDTKQSKGKCYITFLDGKNALNGIHYLNGKIFMGRLTRCTAAEEDPFQILHRQSQINIIIIINAGNSQYKEEKRLQQVKEYDNSNKLNNNNNNNDNKWNSFYMNSAAAVSSVAKQLNIESSNIISASQKGAAVRAAVAEALLSNEIKNILTEEKINLNVLENTLQQNLLAPRSTTTILVKNIDLNNNNKDKDNNNNNNNTTPAAALYKLFSKYGPIEKCVYPSSGVFALFRYQNSQDAAIAFKRLSFYLFYQSPLFLEWAPIGCIQEEEEEEDNNNNNNNNNNNLELDDEEEDHKEAELLQKRAVFTLFITNIPFKTTEDEFYAFLLDACPRLAKPNNNNENNNNGVKHLQLLASAGQAFLTLQDEKSLRYALQKLNQKVFKNRPLKVEISKQTSQQILSETSPIVMHPNNNKNMNHNNNNEEEEEDIIFSKTGAHHHHHNSHNGVPAGGDPYKLIVKNLPFEATEKDVRELFSSFAEIKSVRVPQKRNNNNNNSVGGHLQRRNNHKGFAFVEFLSASEAQRALQSLSSTHLYGRHLVLEHAKLENN